VKASSRRMVTATVMTGLVTSVVAMALLTHTSGRAADAPNHNRSAAQHSVKTIKTADATNMVNCNLGGGATVETSIAPSSARSDATVSASSVESNLQAYQGEPMTATLVYLTLPGTVNNVSGSAPGSGPAAGAVTNMLAWEISITVAPSLMTIEAPLPEGAVENPATCTYTHEIVYADASNGQQIMSTQAA